MQFKNCPNFKWTRISHFGVLVNVDVKQQINDKKYHFQFAKWRTTLFPPRSQFSLILHSPRICLTENTGRFSLTFSSAFFACALLRRYNPKPQYILNKTFETMKILLLTRKLEQRFFPHFAKGRKTESEWGMERERKKWNLEEKSPDREMNGTTIQHSILTETKEKWSLLKWNSIKNCIESTNKEKNGEKVQ